MDYYSYGVILWELETGHIPFENMDDKGMKHMLIQAKMRPMIPEYTDKNLALLIRRCWQDNAEKRLDFKRILQHLERVEFSS